jgi:hypothetical protein
MVRVVSGVCRVGIEIVVPASPIGTDTRLTLDDAIAVIHPGSFAFVDKERIAVIKGFKGLGCLAVRFVALPSAA